MTMRTSCSCTVRLVLELLAQEEIASPSLVPTQLQRGLLIVVAPAHVERIGQAIDALRRVHHQLILRVEDVVEPRVHRQDWAVPFALWWKAADGGCTRQYLRECATSH